MSSTCIRVLHVTMPLVHVTPHDLEQLFKVEENLPVVLTLYVAVGFCQLYKHANMANTCAHALCSTAPLREHHPYLYLELVIPYCRVWGVRAVFDDVDIILPKCNVLYCVRLERKTVCLCVSDPKAVIEDVSRFDEAQGWASLVAKIYYWLGLLATLCKVIVCHTSANLSSRHLATHGQMVKENAHFEF